MGLNSRKRARLGGEQLERRNLFTGVGFVAPMELDINLVNRADETVETDTAETARVDPYKTFKFQVG